MLRPYLIATLGYPGSGKTHFSEKLARQKGFFHLNADRERLRLFKNPQYTSEEHQALAVAMDQIAEELLKKGTSVIYDVNFNKLLSRKRIEMIAENTGAQYYLVHILTRETIAKERLRTRGINTTQDRELYRPVSLEVFHTLRAEFEEPETTEAVIKIDGEAAFEEQLVQFYEVVVWD